MLKDKLSVCVVTHIVDVDTSPYLNNDMILETVYSAHSRLNLEDVCFYICHDARLKKSHPELSEIYLNNLKKSFSEDRFKDINVKVLDETEELLRGNYINIAEKCNTPYMLFLEHDWEFKRDIDVHKIIDTFELVDELKYLRFQKFAQTQNDSYPSHNFWDHYYENVTETSETIPMTRVSFFSGNPHIIRVESFLKEYLPKLYHFFPIERTKGTSHFEKEFYDIIQGDIHRLGPENAHKIWGTFAYDNIPCEQVVSHLGDWCRKR
jgi:hypothetical protein